MKRANRKCIICGKMYEYCNSCSKYINKPAWMAMFDTKDCLGIYDTCVAYRDGEIKIGEAKRKLEVLDLTNLEEFEPGTRDLIKKILDIKNDVVEEKVEEVKDVEVTETEAETKIPTETVVTVKLDTESMIETKDVKTSEGDMQVSNGSNSTSFIKKKTAKSKR